jgi:cation diffusion facilitator CzcD-associated flavoprotein CzcO
MIASTAQDRTERYCIVGAGSSGLAAARRFQEAGLPFDCLEREADLGGNWRFGNSASSVYASTHLISSKRLTQYVDFPMDERLPHFPSHRQVWEYLNQFADHFQLRSRIEFETPIQRIEPAEPGWLVHLASGEARHYRGVVIANGHNWDPRWPEYPGEFRGEMLHSSEYKAPDVLRNQRVLVVGGGNSGCDLAVEAAIHARSAIHSTRRAYHVMPKFFRGKPIDECGELLLACRLPLWLRRWAASLVARVVLGPPDRTGLPQPDHRLFECHPIINSQIHHHVGHGRLVLRPDIARLEGDEVRFVDGTCDRVDVILWATGFRISFPFIDRAHLNWQTTASDPEGSPSLYLNIFHPTRNDLFCIGLIQPDSGQFGLVDYQSQLVAQYVRALRSQSSQAAWFQQLKQGPPPGLSGGIGYVDTPRHRLEVEHFSYRQRLRKLINRLAK